MSNERKLTIGDGRYVDIRVDVFHIHKAFFSICSGARNQSIEDSIILAHHICRETTATKTEVQMKDLSLLMTVYVSEFDGNIKSTEPFSLQDEWNNFLTHGQGIDNDQTHKPTDDGRGK